MLQVINSVHAIPGCAYTGG